MSDQSFIISAALPLQQAEPPFGRLVNGIGLLALLLIVSLCLVAFVVILVALLPKTSERSKITLLKAPWRAFFVGLANYLFLGGISLVLLSTEIEPLALIGILIAAILAAITVLGLPGLVMLAGERLAALAGRQVSALKQLIWGMIALELAGLLPFVGWFLLTPVLLMVSFGAAVLAWRNRKQTGAGE